MEWQERRSTNTAGYIAANENGTGGGALLWTSASKQSDGKTDAATASAAATTLSTIVVRAEPHTRITLAVLKSIGYAKIFRVDEMTPSLLEIGENGAQTEQLIRSHDDLRTRLTSKQSQIDDLLKRAESLAGEQTADADALVYASMAESLALTWKDLVRQLELRGFILRDASRFHALAQDHERLTKHTNSMLRQVIDAKDGNAASASSPLKPEQLFASVQQSVNELIEVTVQAVDVGSQLIAHIRVLGALADNAERPREVVDACLHVEKLMLKMAQNWESVDSCWAQERVKLQDAIAQRAIRSSVTNATPLPPGRDAESDAERLAVANLNAADAWLDAARQTDASATEVRAAAGCGGSALTAAANEAAEILLEEVKKRRETLKALDVADVSPTTRQRLDVTLRKYDAFASQLAQRMSADEGVRHFFAHSDSVLHQLRLMADELVGANASMAGELAPLAHQKAAAVVEVGERLLSAETTRADADYERVNARLADVRAQLAVVDALARQRIAEAKELNVKLRAQLAALSDWLHRGVEVPLAAAAPLGVDHATSSTFSKHHKQLSAELTAHEPQLAAVVTHAPEMAAADRRALAELQRRFDATRHTLNARVGVSRDFEQVLKFARELDAQLTTAFTVSAVEGKLSRQNALQSIRETLQREKHHAHKFVESATSMQRVDPPFDTDAAVELTRKLILEHEKRFTRLLDASPRPVDTAVAALPPQPEASETLREVRNWQTETETLIGRVEVALERHATAEYGTDAETLADDARERQYASRRVDESLAQLSAVDQRLANVKSSSASLEGGDRVTELDALEARQRTIEGRLRTLKAEVERWKNIDGRKQLNEQHHNYHHHQQQEDGSTVQGERRFVVESKSPTTAVVTTTDGEDGTTKIKQQTTTTTITRRTERYVVAGAAENVEKPEQQQLLSQKFFDRQQEHHQGEAESRQQLLLGDRQQQQQKQSEGGVLAPSSSGKPHIVEELRGVLNVSAGETIVLECVIVGTPEPSVIWYKEEECVQEDPPRVQLFFHGDRCALVIRDARADDAFLYKVVAVNEHGRCASFCRVSVAATGGARSTASSPTRRRSGPMPPPKPTLDGGGASFRGRPPTFDMALSNQIVGEGEPAIFQIYVYGSPPPRITWYRDDRVISDPANGGGSVDPDLYQIDVSEQGFQRCVVLSASPRLAGVYMIVAENPSGEARSGASLSVVPSTLGATTFYAERNTHQLPLHQQQQQKQQQQWQTTKHQTSFLVNENDPIAQQTVTDIRPSPGGYAGVDGGNYGAERYLAAAAASNASADKGYSSIANAPEFIRPLEPEYTVEEGDTSAALHCDMVGVPRPRVHWFFDGRPLTSDQRFAELRNVGDTYSLVLRPAARAEHAGHYRMVAENIGGRTESVALVHVRPRSMIPQPAQSAVPTRKTVGASPTTRRGQPPTAVHSYYYYSPAAASQSSPEHYDHHHHYNPHRERRFMTPPPPAPFPVSNASTAAAAPMSTSLYISSTQPYCQGMSPNVAQTRTSTASYAPAAGQQQFQQQQQHKYSTVGGPPVRESPFGGSAADVPVEVTRQAMISSSSAADLKAAAAGANGGTPPHFHQTLVSCVVTAGEPAKFEALVSGSPRPQVDWTKDGEPLLPNGGDTMLAFVESGNGAVALRFRATAAHQAGKYICTAQNAHGIATSSAQLVVRPQTLAPDFVRRLVSEELVEGDRLKWTVKISGDPPPSVLWLRDGEAVPDCDVVHLVQESPNEYSLIIDRVELADAGQFTCLLENEAGEARSTADLVVREVGARPGTYYHVTKVTQEKQVKGEEVSRDEIFTVEPSPPPRAAASADRQPSTRI